MRRPRLTTRRIMALVLGLAVALGLAVPAAQVAADREQHLHVWYEDRPEPPPLGMYLPPGVRMSAMRMEVQPRPPFWPRYWRRLLGRRGRPACPGDPGRPLETCSLRPGEPLAGPALATRGAP